MALRRERAPRASPLVHPADRVSSVHPVTHADETTEPEPRFDGSLPPPDPRTRARFHLLFGWAALFGFAAIGLALEALHGFKVGAYLDVGNETRRLMWRLGHAHGVLLGLTNIALGVTMAAFDADGRALRLGGRGLAMASVLMPLGFLGAGVDAHGGDPGAAIALVPLAGGVLLVSLGALAWGMRSAR